MSTPVFPPMPAFISRVEAAEQFGAGSTLHRIVSRFDPPPPPTPEEQAEIDRVRAAAILANDVWRQAVNLQAGFGVLGECHSLVEAHATALFEADGSGAFTLSEWRELARCHLSVLYERSPELLPVGPAVHADCHGDDR